MNETVGFIGLGTMGLPMASNLAKAGVRLIVHDTSAAARDAAAQLGGVTVATGAGEVATRADILFTCLPNDAIVKTAYLGEGGVASAGKRGLITCDCSTVSPEATLEVARGLAARGITHMDTPMLEETKRTYDEAVEKGWGREDFSAVTHVIERRIGRKLSKG